MAPINKEHERQILQERFGSQTSFESSENKAALSEGVSPLLLAAEEKPGNETSDAFGEIFAKLQDHERRLRRLGA
jgi:hypothetical protein